MVEDQPSTVRVDQLQVRNSENYENSHARIIVEESLTNHQPRTSFVTATRSAIGLPMPAQPLDQ
jgi:hypothetical protein